jgi:hypothetical protein
LANGVLPSVDQLFGDGSDGDVTFASDTTLTRDMYYHSLTVGSGTKLDPGGYRIFVSGTLTLGDGAMIARNGHDANPNTSAGADGLPSGTLGAGGKGGGADINADSETNSLGGAGVVETATLAPVR